MKRAPLALALLCLLLPTVGATGAPKPPTAERAVAFVPSGFVAAAGDIACPSDKDRGPVQCHADATAYLIRKADGPFDPGGVRPNAILPLGDMQYPVGNLAQFTYRNPGCQTRPVFLLGDTRSCSFDDSWGRTVRDHRQPGPPDHRQPRVRELRRLGVVRPADLAELPQGLWHGAVLRRRGGRSVGRGDALHRRQGVRRRQGQLLLHVRYLSDADAVRGAQHRCLQRQRGQRAAVQRDGPAGAADQVPPQDPLRQCAEPARCLRGRLLPPASVEPLRLPDARDTCAVSGTNCSTPRSPSRSAPISC